MALLSLKKSRQTCSVRPFASVVAAAGAIVFSAGCSGLVNPEAGFSTVKDPGTVLVSVADQMSFPIKDVDVAVHDIPNAVGSFYSRGQSTDGGGVAKFYSISAGRHRVEIKAPIGYETGNFPTIKEVDVVKGETVSVDFRLVRK